MFTPRHRRGIGIAATCAAVAMAVGMASPAFAATTSADGQDPLVLTPEQVEDLTARAQADVYRDVSSEGAEPAEPAAPETGPESSDGGNTLDAETDAVTWKHTVRSAVEGDYGMITTAPVAGGGEDYFAIDSLGLVQRRTAAGAEVWRRDNASWYADWAVKPARPWQAEPFPARIVVGYNAVSPFTPASEDGFATGDLTGDGVADLAFSASVGSAPYRPMQGTLSTGTFVTIIDGADGHTLWSKLYAAVYSLELVDGTLDGGRLAGLQHQRPCHVEDGPARPHLQRCRRPARDGFVVDVRSRSPESVGLGGSRTDRRRPARGILESPQGRPRHGSQRQHRGARRGQRSGHVECRRIASIHDSCAWMPHATGS